VSSRSAYDAVDYPSFALPQAHPAHLYAVARMFGLRPAAVERCRYLEVGCGDGTHLIASAVGLPDATFVGIDRSAPAVDRGNRVVAELGLANVSLIAADLTGWEPPAGGFDYAVAHGLYSWVPAPVRDALLGLLARAIRPHGVAYVSYNTYPGCYVRRMVWEILRYHTAGVVDPAAKVPQALAMARFLRAGRPGNQPADAALALLDPELKEIIEARDAGVLYHDDLGEVNEPVYFHEFAAHAGRFGLRFVAEAEQHLMETRGFAPDVDGLLNGMASQDVLRKEQYIDFLRLRRFRQTLLCPDGAIPYAGPDPAAVSGLAVSGDPKPETDPVELTGEPAVTFRTDRGAAARVHSEVEQAALLALAGCWPARLPFGDLLRATARGLGREPKPGEADALARFLTAAWMTGLVELHGHCPRYAREVSARPVASPLARVQLRAGTQATTLLHTTVKFEDVVSRGLVLLLDGTRDLDRIVADLSGAFPPDRRPDAGAFRAGVERNLARLARSGLLVG
jgi:SAM-dependent methyltransferase